MCRYSPSVATSEFFCWGGGWGGVEGIERAECTSEGARIQKFLQNGRFFLFVPSDGRNEGGKASDEERGLGATDVVHMVNVL